MKLKDSHPKHIGNKTSGCTQERRGKQRTLLKEESEELGKAKRKLSRTSPLGLGYSGSKEPEKFFSLPKSRKEEGDGARKWGLV